MILLGAIAVGVIAALLLFQYIRGIEDKAFEKAKRVDVYMAIGEIKRSTPGSEAVASGNIDQAAIPQQFKPSTAISTTDEIAPKVALFDIAPGTVIVNGMFVDPVTTQISFRQRLKRPDYVAISIATDPLHGVAGLLVPTDEVNMIVFENLENLDEEQNQGEPAPAAQAPLQTPEEDPAAAGTEVAVFSQRARMLYQKVQILAVGQTARLEPGETIDPDAPANNAGAGTVTLAVPPDASLWIATAQQAGGIYMTLVGEEYSATEIDRVPRVFERLPGEQPDVLTPYGPGGAPK